MRTVQAGLVVGGVSEVIAAMMGGVEAEEWAAAAVMPMWSRSSSESFVRIDGVRCWDGLEVEVATHSEMMLVAGREVARPGFEEYDDPFVPLAPFVWAPLPFV